jgi:hypothetical protein
VYGRRDQEAVCRGLRVAVLAGGTFRGVLRATQHGDAGGAAVGDDGVITLSATAVLLVIALTTLSSSVRLHLGYGLSGSLVVHHRAVVGIGSHQGLARQVVDRPGQPSSRLVDAGHSIVGKEGVLAAG